MRASQGAGYYRNKTIQGPLVTATLQKGLKEPVAELERHGQRHMSEDSVSST